MAELRLKSQRFRQEREQDWQRLERIMDKVERGGPSALTDDEILAVPVLYRATLSSLSVARATSLDRSLIDYLETLTARAYFFVYGARSTVGSRVASFFSGDWPRAVRALWRETIVAGLLFAIGVMASWFLVAQDRDWYYAFVPSGLAGGRDPTATTEFLRSVLYDGQDEEGLGVFATFLFTHNAQISIMAFALGFAFGIPTAVLEVYNGTTLGAMLALYSSRGLGVELAGWLLIHGVTELFAIVLAGAAGFRIGWSIAFPGDRTRMQAALEAGRTAATVMGGVVVMLFFAGLLEGFGRQLIVVDEVRFAIAAATGLMWALYFYGPRPRSSHG